MAAIDKFLEAYESRGRHLQSLDLSALKQRWYGAIQQANSATGQRYVDAMWEMNYIEVEYLLRGLQPPGPRLCWKTRRRMQHPPSSSC
jgi:hypothetical protein